MAKRKSLFLTDGQVNGDWWELGLMKLPYETEKDNAAHIVHCVNSHDGLVAKITELEAEVACLRDDNLRNVGNIGDGFI